MVKDINNIDPKLLEQEDRIVSYLKGQMSEDEEKQFLKDLEENPELKKSAISTARLVKGLKQVGTQDDRDIIDAFLASSEESVITAAKDAIALNAAVKDLEKIKLESERRCAEMEADVPKKPKIVALRKASTWMSIAASLIFVVWFGFEYFDYRVTTGLGDQYGNTFSTEMIARGDAKGDVSSNAEQKLQKLFNDVKEKKDLDNAIHELSLCWEISQMETYNDYTDYSSEIGWNLAIAYLKGNDRNNAKSVLERLVEFSEEGSAISLKAKELLGKLK